MRATSSDRTGWFVALLVVALLAALGGAGDRLDEVDAFDDGFTDGGW